MKKNVIWRRIGSLLLLTALFGAVSSCDRTTVPPSTSGSTSTTSSPSTEATSSTTSVSATTTEEAVPTYTLEELLSDYDHLVEHLGSNPFLFTDPEEYNAAKESQRNLIVDGMTDLEFYRVIAVLIASVRCGHSAVRAPSAAEEDFFYGDRTYPVEVRLFDGRLLVVEAFEDSPFEQGDEILSVDGRSVPELTEDMKRFISADGDGTTIKTAALSRDYFSYYLLFLAEDDSLAVAYWDASLETTAEITLERDAPAARGQEILPPYESFFGEGYAVLTVREFSPYGVYTIEAFADFFETFFTAVENEGIGQVILDIRSNGGGDPRITSNLFSYLMMTPQPYFRADSPDYYAGLKQNLERADHPYGGQLYTLIDPFCFSSTGHFAALLKYQNVGMFIGEETNGSFICSDSSREYRLANTGLRFRTSTAVWAVDVEGMVQGRGVLPDWEVKTGYADYVSGVDAVMAAALGLIEEALNP